MAKTKKPKISLPVATPVCNCECKTDIKKVDLPVFGQKSNSLEIIPDALKDALSSVDNQIKSDINTIQSTLNKSLSFNKLDTNLNKITDNIKGLSEIDIQNKLSGLTKQTLTFGDNTSLNKLLPKVPTNLTPLTEFNNIIKNCATNVINKLNAANLDKLGTNISLPTIKAPDINTIISGLQDLTTISLSQLVPSFEFNPVIVPKLKTQILSEVAQKCFSKLLVDLNKLDPLERLDELISIASQLCQSGLFDQLRTVIESIRQAKRDIIMTAVSQITDPVAKLEALNSYLTDAINNGAQDLVEDIIGMIQNQKFNDILTSLQTLDPNQAIALLSA
jgi:DNA polymerase III delta prime subunit